MRRYPSLILLPVLLGIFATTGCGIRVGDHVRDLVARRGHPDQIKHINSGNKIYTYYDGITWTDGKGTFFQETGSTLRIATEGKIERTTYWINNEGIIYHKHVHGDDSFLDDD